MSAKELQVLREKQEQLVDLYKANGTSARSLQQTLERDILPGLVDELSLDGAGEQKAKLWLNDSQSVFRLLRRHKFTVSFALENARDLLVWRLAVIPDEIPRPSISFFQVLPLTALDPNHRPIVVINLVKLLESLEDVRTTLTHYMELLRLNLKAINDAGTGDADRHDPPILQYVALVDIGGISIQSVQNVELISWFIYELVPRFPGMLAAVFVLNYSWAHSGVWSLVKRALPKSALSRVFFPSQDELLEYFPSSAIPRDYGGSLPALSELEDPLENYMATLQTGPSLPVAEIPPTTSADQPSSPSASAKPISRVPSISPTSHLNPYFGYPVSGRGAPTPRLRHGRQRKRDLLRTLAALWWNKWKHRVVLLLCLILAIVSYRLRRNPRLLRWTQSAGGLLCPPART